MREVYFMNRCVGIRTLFFSILAVLLLSFQQATGQGRVITGTVSDEDSQPIPGATVLVKGSVLGTITDLNGQFRLEIPSDLNQPLLVVSFVGYISEEIDISSQSVVTVNLAVDVLSLEEVARTSKLREKIFRD